MEPNETTNAQPAEAVARESTDSTHATEAGAAAQTSTEISQYRTFAMLGYILPFLFFLPLLDDKIKNVPYVRFHANQQLVLLVVIIVTSILHNFLFVLLMWLGYIVYQVLNMAIIGLAIFGAYNAYYDKMKELPFIGQFRILK